MKKWLLATLFFLVAADPCMARTTQLTINTAYRGRIPGFVVLIMNTDRATTCATEQCSVTLCPIEDPACRERRFPPGTIVAFPRDGIWNMTLPVGTNPYWARDKLDEAVDKVFNLEHRTRN